jgi:hypothetical protein
VIREAEYSSYGKEAGTTTRQRDIEAVGNRATLTREKVEKT